MASFLARQRLQRLAPLLNATALHMMDQDMSGSIPKHCSQPNYLSLVFDSLKLGQFDPKILVKVRVTSQKL